MNIIEQITNYLEELAQIIPVEAFTFIGALIEEIIAPIPSPVVMTLAGSVAGSQMKPVIYLLVLSVIGAIGKIIGSYLLYVISDRAEDVLIKRFGGFIGVSAQDVIDWGEHFNQGKRDFVIIFLARFIPIVPTAPISVIAGLLKLDVKTYLSASFLGYLGRNLIYLYFGYVGFESYKALIGGLDSIESLMQIIIALGVFGFICWLYYKRSKTKGSDIIKNFLKKKQP